MTVDLPRYTELLRAALEAAEAVGERNGRNVGPDNVAAHQELLVAEGKARRALTDFLLEAEGIVSIRAGTLDDMFREEAPASDKAS
jgi:hypothetical protein